jgi:hypothetical protein
MKTIITEDTLDECMVEDWFVREFEEQDLYGKSLNEIARFYLQKKEIWSLFDMLRALRLEHRVEEFGDVLIEFKDVKACNGLTILDIAYMIKSNDIINFLNGVAKEQKNDVDNEKKKGDGTVTFVEAAFQSKDWVRIDIQDGDCVKISGIQYTSKEYKNNFFNNNMAQTITATGDIVAFCGLLKEIKKEYGSNYGLSNKIYSFFKDFIHSRKTKTMRDSDLRTTDIYYIPSMCFKIDSIKVTNGIDFYQKELVVELEKKDTANVAKLFADGEKKIMFDILMTPKDNGSVEYKYTNFRKII